MRLPRLSQRHEPTDDIHRGQPDPPAFFAYPTDVPAWCRRLPAWLGKTTPFDVITARVGRRPRRATIWARSAPLAVIISLLLLTTAAVLAPRTCAAASRLRCCLARRSDMFDTSSAASTEDLLLRRLAFAGIASLWSFLILLVSPVFALRRHGGGGAAARPAHVMTHAAVRGMIPGLRSHRGDRCYCLPHYPNESLVIAHVHRSSLTRHPPTVVRIRAPSISSESLRLPTEAQLHKQRSKRLCQSHVGNIRTHLLDIATSPPAIPDLDLTAAPSTPALAVHTGGNAPRDVVRLLQPQNQQP